MKNKLEPYSLADIQCDQMARWFVQYFAIFHNINLQNSNWNLPKSVKILPNTQYALQNSQRLDILPNGVLSFVNKCLLKHSKH